MEEKWIIPKTQEKRAEQVANLREKFAEVGEERQEFVVFQELPPRVP